MVMLGWITFALSVHALILRILEGLFNERH